MCERERVSWSGAMENCSAANTSVVSGTAAFPKPDEPITSAEQEKIINDTMNNFNSRFSPLPVLFPPPLSLDY